MYSLIKTIISIWQTLKWYNNPYFLESSDLEGKSHNWGTKLIKMHKYNDKPSIRFLGNT